MTFLIRKCAAELQLKFRWLGSVPYIIVEAASTDMAEQAANQLREANDIDMTPLDRSLRDEPLTGLEELLIC